MKTWKKFKEDNNINLSEAETLRWGSLSTSERKELLRDVRLPSSFAKDSWKDLDFRAKEKLGKYISKTTMGEFRLDEGHDTYYEFPNDKLAKQFAKDIANAGVATGTVSGNRVIDLEFLKSSSAGLSVKALKKYLKQNRGKGPMFYKESVELDEKSQRFGGDVNIPASKDTTKYIENATSSQILMNVQSALHPTARFLVIKNPNAGRSQDKVLMAITSDPKRRPMKMFSFFGTHVSPQKAMQFAKHHKLVAMKDKDGNPLYAKESIELGEEVPANVKKIAKELDDAVALHSSQSKRLKAAGIEDNEDMPKNVRDIPKELDKAVAKHKSQSERLKKAGIVENTPTYREMKLDEMDAGMRKRFYDEVHAELKKVMDKQYYREFRASNGGRALENVINHMGKSRGYRVDKTVQSIIDKYGRNRDEYVKLSFQMAAKGRMNEGTTYKNTMSAAELKKRAKKAPAKESTKLREERTLIFTMKGNKNKIVKDMEKKFGQYYDGAGQGAGSDEWDMSFTVDMKMFNKISDYVAKKYGKNTVHRDFMDEHTKKWHDAAKLEEGKYDSDARIKKMSDKGKTLLAMMANSFGETGGPYLDINNVHNLTTYAIDRIVKKLKKIENKLPSDKKKEMALVMKELGEGVKKEMNTTTSVGTLTDPKDMGGRTALGKKKKKKELSKYTESEIFTVSSSDYNRCIKGRKKNERWNKFFNKESDMGAKIRKYSLRNPNAPIVIKNEETGDMMYLRRRLNDQRLKHNRRKR
tara:strand:- start:4744 stop:7002 length:2259 start_codon:yes stop_codon:yes gene_type:complete